MLCSWLSRSFLRPAMPGAEDVATRRRRQHRAVFLQQETPVMSPFTNMSKKLPLSMGIAAQSQRARDAQEAILALGRRDGGPHAAEHAPGHEQPGQRLGFAAREIGAAHSGDTIAFSSGLKGQTITLSTGELEITTNLNIDGRGAGQVSVTGGGASRVFNISQNATVTVGYLTITDGLVVADNGGGILVGAGSVLNLNHVVMTGNQAMADSTGALGGSGGAIENWGTLNVSSATFINNEASLSSIFVGSNGGAIDSAGPSLSVTNSTFTRNIADGTATLRGGGDGGAINTDGSAAIITNCTFNRNLATRPNRQRRRDQHRR